MRRCLFLLLSSLILFSFLVSVYAYSVPSDTIVYVTDTGSCYHREDCTYLSSSHSMTISYAESCGYRACSRCQPDVITGEYEPSDSSNASSRSSPITSHSAIIENHSSNLAERSFLQKLSDFSQDVFAIFVSFSILIAIFRILSFILERKK